MYKEGKKWQEERRVGKTKEQRKEEEERKEENEKGGKRIPNSPGTSICVASPTTNSITILAFLASSFAIAIISGIELVSKMAINGELIPHKVKYNARKITIEHN